MSSIGFSQVYISELSYNPCTAQGSDSACEYVILTNGGASPIDISGWSIATAFGFTFPAGTMIPAGGTLSLGISANCAGLAAFDIAGGWSGGLMNGGETVDILDASGNFVSSVTYTSGDGANGNCDALCFDVSGNVAECASSQEATACMITNVALTANSIVCSGNDVSYEVCGTVAGGSGDYDLVDTNNANAILASLTGQADGMICFSVTIPGPTTANTISVDIFDASDMNCSGGIPVAVAIPTCPCGASITSFPANGN